MKSIYYKIIDMNMFKMVGISVLVSDPRDHVTIDNTSSYSIHSAGFCAMVVWIMIFYHIFFFFACFYDFKHIGIIGPIKETY